MSLTVVALGGNALLRRGEALEPRTQARNVADAAVAIAAAVAPTERLVVTHGNGPQVGLLALADASRAGTAFPLDVLDAETEGMIGYLLVRELHAASNRPAVALLTQVVVDRADPAFAHPTKPVGPRYEADVAQALALRQGWRIIPEAGADPACWRRVVPSPEPCRIVELGSITALLDAGRIVVCAGGGGVPVVEDGPRLVGVEAVVDKDATTALLAAQLGADRLVLLTDVDGVVEGWGTSDARVLADATPAELRRLDLADGSMGPKVRAACGFVERTGRPAVIGSLDRAAAVLAGRSGTWIHPVPLAAR